MKLANIEIGGRYVARVSGNFVVVRVTNIYETVKWTKSGDRSMTRVDAVNEKTGRRLVGMTAARLRRPATIAS